MRAFWLILSVAVALTFDVTAKTLIRVGHFPTLTHAQGVIGHGLTREGKGWFEKYLGDDVEVVWYVYDAGPSAMEALLAGSVDLVYVGPSPTINAYEKSGRDSLRVIAGACSGGAALVIQGDSKIEKPADFRGKRIGTPQLGNTQDIAARAWLMSQGFTVTLTGGDVSVVPSSNPSLLTMFLRQLVDGAWTVEPWVSRLTSEAKGKIFLEESSLWPQTNGRYITTHLVSTAQFNDEKADLIKKWLTGHVELTEWIKSHTDEAQAIVKKELLTETHFSLPEGILASAWKKIELTYDPLSSTLRKYAQEAHRLGFLKEEPDLTRLYALQALNSILKEKKLPEVQ